MDIMMHPKPWSETCSDRASTGQPWWLTLSRLCSPAKDVNTTLGRPHLLDQALQMIPITWLFMVLGLDMVGPLKRAPEGYTHLLVAVDKFTKRIEARPISVIKSEQTMLFFLDIVHRFGVLNSIIRDNGT